MHLSLADSRPLQATVCPAPPVMFGQDAQAIPYPPEVACTLRAHVPSEPVGVALKVGVVPPLEMNANVAFPLVVVRVLDVMLVPPEREVLIVA